MGETWVATVLKILHRAVFGTFSNPATLNISNGSRGTPPEFSRDHGQISPGNRSQFTFVLTSDLPHGIIEELLYCTGITVDFFCD